MTDTKVVAVVSGKGGSGKTMLCTTFAFVLAEAGERVLLIDADTATAGLTYYLGVNYVRNTRTGLSDLMRLEEVDVFDLLNCIQPLSASDIGLRIAFLSVGDHRRFLTMGDYADEAQVLTKVMKAALKLPGFDTIVVDCRGGIDHASLAVCETAEDIIIVTEPDITAYQATRHLVNVLSDNRVAGKLRGFYLNKVFQDPSYILARGTSEFGCQPLAAIPYDVQATRGFFIGDLPGKRSSYYQHVQAGLGRAYPEMSIPWTQVWQAMDYERASLTDPDGARGGAFAAIALVFIAVVNLFLDFLPGPIAYSRILYLSIFYYAVLFGILGSLPRLRRLLGRGIWFYLVVLNPSYRNKAKSESRRRSSIALANRRGEAGHQEDYRPR